MGTGHPLNNMWAYSVNESGKLIYGGKFLGFQGDYGVIQVWNAFSFVAAGTVELTDQIEYVDRKDIKTFLTPRACVESACERIARYSSSYR